MHNSIEARFELEDGKIVRHQDSFDLWKWAGQALGWKGKLLGWSPPLQKVLRQQARDVDSHDVEHGTPFFVGRVADPR